MRTSHVLILGAVVLAVASAAALFLLTDGAGDALEGPTALDPGGGQPGAGAQLAGGTSSEGDGGRVSEFGGAAGAEELNAAGDAELPALLVGRVVDSDGAPVVDAEVLARNGASWSRLPLELEGQERDRGSERVAARTGDDGRFVIREGLTPGELRLVARAPGFAARRVEGERLPDRPPLDLGDVRLERAVVLAGRVVDRAGEPVPGAGILLAVERGVAGMAVTVLGKGIPLGETDAKGRFRLDQVPHGPWRLIVDGPGFVVREEAGETQAPGDVRDDLIFVLERGDSIAGTVVDVPDELRGTPLRVEARPVSGGDNEAAPEVHRRARVAMVAAGGAFEVTGLAGGGRFNLTLWTEADGRWSRAPRSTALEAYAGTRGVELGFRQDTAFNVRVVDAETSAPVSAYVLWAATGDNGRMTSLKREDDDGEPLRAHPDGRARYGGLRPPRQDPLTVRLRVRAIGYADFELGPVELERDAENDLGTLALTPTPVVRVTVVAPDDEPVEGARVYLAESGSEGLAWYARRGTRTAWASDDVRYAETNADGVARLSAPGPVACDVFAAADGFVPCALEPLGLLPGEDAEIRLTLQVGAAVSARVRDARGGAVAGVKVLARVETAGGTATEDGWGMGWDVASDALGVARFENLPPGTYRFAVEPEGTGGRWGGPEIPDDAWQRRVLDDGDDATIELEAPARGLLRGRVTEGGESLAGASLRLTMAGQSQGRGGGDARYSALTTHDGLFEFSGIGQGEYVLTVGHPDRTMGFRTDVTVAAREELVEVNLPLSMIEGHVTDRAGTPLAGVEVRVAYVDRRQWGGSSGWTIAMVEDDEGRLRTDFGQGAASLARTASDGSYRLRGVAVDGALRLSVRGEYITDAFIEDVLIAPDEIRRDVDFVVDRAGRIQVRFDGRPQQRYHATAEPPEELETASVSGALDRNRRSRLGPCLPGDWTVVVRRVEGGGETVEVERHAVRVRAGETTTLELRLP